MTTNKYTLLCHKLKTPGCTPELRQALTHNSFFEQRKAAKDNSVYIFLGMFAFKGVVADLLSRYSGMNGKQLQHLLGNLFKNEALEPIFVYFDLQEHIRYGVHFEPERQQHLFVFALLGFLYRHAPQEILEDFISTHILLPNRHLFEQGENNYDRKGQCNFLSKMLYKKKITITTTGKQSEIRHTEIHCGGEKIAEFESISYRYSRKQALKLALLNLAAKADEKRRYSSDYNNLEQHLENLKQQKIAAEREKKMQAFQEKEARKKAEREARKAEQARQKNQKDLQRRNAKAASKTRKEQQAKTLAEQAAKMANMSANKRRHLQDKGQL